MVKIDIFPLPDLILLEQYGGNFPAYLEAVYSAFKKDFIDKKPTFRGIRLGLKKYPMQEGKEATFWHMTSEGEDEATRTPDLRRLERIKWPAPMINNSNHSYLKVWENKRGIKSNILIFHEKEQYLVVLRKGKDYLLPWTAYFVEHEARKQKLLKEYEAYINAKSA
ncbi:MAG: rflB [Bacteroidetes bacterium]|nr:rflB [Bacteroidota bacterium]